MVAAEAEAAAPTLPAASRAGRAASPRSRAALELPGQAWRPAKKADSAFSRPEYISVGPERSTLAETLHGGDAHEGYTQFAFAQGSRYVGKNFSAGQSPFAGGFSRPEYMDSGPRKEGSDEQSPRHKGGGFYMHSDCASPLPAKTNKSFLSVPEHTPPGGDVYASAPNNGIACGLPRSRGGWLQNHGLAASKEWFQKLQVAGDSPRGAGSSRPDTGRSPYITWKRDDQLRPDAPGIPSRTSSAETTAAEWANAADSAKHWEEAFKETIHPSLTRTLPSVDEFRIQVRGAVDELWRGMDMDMQKGLPLGGKVYKDWMTGDKQNLSWHNSQRAAEMRFRTRDLDDESSDSGDSDDQNAVADDVLPPASAPDAGEGARQKGAVEKPGEEDTRAIIEALISMDVAEPLAAEAAEATGSQGVAQALRWVLEERQEDPRVGASWRCGVSRPSTAGTISQFCVPASPSSYQPSQSQSRPATGVSTPDAAMQPEARPPSVRPGTAGTAYSSGAASTHSMASRPKTAILKRTISQGDDGLAASRPKPPSTPRLHSAFGGPNPYKITTVSKDVDAKHYVRGTEEYKRLRLIDQDPYYKRAAVNAETSPQTCKVDLTKAWAPVATRQILKLQMREGMTTPWDPIPGEAFADRPLPPEPSAIKDWYQERMQVLEARKHEHFRTHAAKKSAPHLKIHTLTSDDINKKLAAGYDPGRSTGYFLIEKLAEKQTDALIKGFKEIDPQRKGYVSRHELESLLRAWEIPLGPTSLQQILDKICPRSSVSASYPPTELIDYHKLVKTLTGRPFRPVHAAQAKTNPVQVHAANLDSVQPVAHAQPAQGESDGTQDILFMTQPSCSPGSEPPKMPVREENVGATGSTMHGENLAPQHPRTPRTPRTLGAPSTPRTPRSMHTTGRFSASRASHALRPTTAPQARQRETFTVISPGMEMPRAPRLVAQPGGAGKMSRAIERSIVARRSILGLQEQVMSEINPLASKTAPAHTRKPGPGQQLSAQLSAQRLATGSESEDHEPLYMSQPLSEPGAALADRHQIDQPKSAGPGPQVPTHDSDWHYTRVHPLFDRLRPSTTLTARKSRDCRSGRTRRTVGLS